MFILSVCLDEWPCFVMMDLALLRLKYSTGCNMMCCLICAQKSLSRVFFSPLNVWHQPFLTIWKQRGTNRRDVTINAQTWLQFSYHPYYPYNQANDCDIQLAMQKQIQARLETVLINLAVYPKTPEKSQFSNLKELPLTTASSHVASLLTGQQWLC